MSSSSRFAARKAPKASPITIINGLTMEEIESIEYPLPTLEDLERMRSPLLTDEVRTRLVAVATEITDLETVLSAHISAAGAPALGPIRPFLETLLGKQSELETASNDVKSFGDAKTKPRQLELKGLKDKVAKLTTDIAALEGAYKTFGQREQLEELVGEEGELMLAKATVEDKNLLPAVEKQLALIRAEIVKSKGATMYLKTLVPFYTSRDGVKIDIKEAIMVLPAGGYAIWDSKYMLPSQDGKIAFTASDKNEKAYAFAYAIDCAYEMIHPMLEKEFFSDWISGGSKGPKGVCPPVGVSKLTDPDNTYIKKETGEVIASPHFKFRVEYMASPDVSNGVLRCTLSELEMNEDGGFIIKTPVMLADRPLTLERIESLKAAKNQYLNAFGIIRREFYADCNLKEKQEYAGLAALVESGNPPNDLMTVGDLRAILDKKRNALQIKFNINELCISKAQGVCFAIKALNLGYHISEGYESSSSTVDDSTQDAVNAAMLSMGAL
jgi:hypothetical protein